MMREIRLVFVFTSMINQTIKTDAEQNLKNFRDFQDKFTASLIWDEISIPAKDEILKMKL